jgi:hypothetical protein
MNIIDMLSSVTLIGEAVFARCLSAIKNERVRASKVLSGPQKERFRGDKQMFIDDLEQALYASKLISYTQGFMLMRENSKTVGISYYMFFNSHRILAIRYPGRLESELRWYCQNVARWLYHQGRYTDASRARVTQRPPLN